MYKTVERVLSEEKIEYFSIVPYSLCKEINASIRERMDFQPKSAVIYLLPYYTGEGVNISRYAVSCDYHIAIREIGEALISALKEKYPEGHFSSFGDHSPIDERHAALISGLGIAGDNGLLINEKYGSYVFVGDILTDLEPNEALGFQPREIQRCHSCGACKRACPTRILGGEGEECLSAITQRKGELADTERALMVRYNTAWGCDLCQSVCPYNRSPVMTPIDFFHRERIECLTLEVLDGMDKETFSRRAFAWRGRKTVERNIEILSAVNKGQ